MKIIFLVFITLTTSCLNSGEVNRWDCNKFDGAKIISGDGEFLGELGPKWRTDSIFNDSSSYASTWSQNSIFNTNLALLSPFFNLKSIRGFDVAVKAVSEPERKPDNIISTNKQITSKVVSKDI